ncbi:YdcF family protein [Sphingobium yanoikuyae]|uniref:YdcF family protein n=1 Tax=Sphingobium yanoikuyae TaxID=13690 RepID=UPI0022DE5117|nr:YdcF family protein [Sphingobium yanoikuyae]WBQ16214.1 YdcF family protein [Sphingobium yanoikuyae]
MARRLGRVAASLMTMAAVAITPAPALAGAARDAVTEALSRRLFPVLDALGHDPAALAAFRARPDMDALLHAREDRRTACAGDVDCVAQAQIWTPTEIALMVQAALSLRDVPVADDGAGAQIRREVEGINAILRSYALGQVSAYPDIDGAGTIDPRERQARLRAAAWIAQTPRKGSAQALDSSIDYALALLDVSDRTDAIGFEPLTGGLNAPAMARAKNIDWKRYRYSALIVTGVGPEVDGMPLSPFGKYHLRLAANRFADGDAPFLILTGGRAHPRATRFAEAQEMRQALIERYGVPADAIIIEPYARHTTTNLRNATRLLMAMAAPLDKDTLIVCNPGQSAMIENPLFVQRNDKELGYQPGAIGARLTPTELLFRPSRLSARVDPRDPLDP